MKVWVDESHGIPGQYGTILDSAQDPQSGLAGYQVLMADGRIDLVSADLVHLPNPAFPFVVEGRSLPGGYVDLYGKIVEGPTGPALVTEAIRPGPADALSLLSGQAVTAGKGKRFKLGDQDLGPYDEAWIALMGYPDQAFLERFPVGLGSVLAEKAGKKGIIADLVISDPRGFEQSLTKAHKAKIAAAGYASPADFWSDARRFLDAIGSLPVDPAQPPLVNPFDPILENFSRLIGDPTLIYAGELDRLDENIIRRIQSNSDPAQRSALIQLRGHLDQLQNDLAAGASWQEAARRVARWQGSYTPARNPSQRSLFGPGTSQPRQVRSQSLQREQARLEGRGERGEAWRALRDDRHFAQSHLERLEYLLASLQAGQLTEDQARSIMAAWLRQNPTLPGQQPLFADLAPAKYASRKEQIKTAGGYIDQDEFYAMARTYSEKAAVHANHARNFGKLAAADELQWAADFLRSVAEYPESYPGTKNDKRDVELAINTVQKYLKQKPIKINPAPIYFQDEIAGSFGRTMQHIMQALDQNGNNLGFLRYDLPPAGRPEVTQIEGPAPIRKALIDRLKAQHGRSARLPNPPIEVLIDTVHPQPFTATIESTTGQVLDAPGFKAYKGAIYGSGWTAPTLQALQLEMKRKDFSTPAQAWEQFRTWNAQLAEEIDKHSPAGSPYVGVELDEKDSSGALFDAINERYGLKGKNKVKSTEQAIKRIVKKEKIKRWEDFPLDLIQSGPGGFLQWTQAPQVSESLLEYEGTDQSDLERALAAARNKWGYLWNLRNALEFQRKRGLIDATQYASYMKEWEKLAAVEEITDPAYLALLGDTLKPPAPWPSWMEEAPELIDYSGPPLEEVIPYYGPDLPYYEESELIK